MMIVRLFPEYLPFPEEEGEEMRLPVRVECSLATNLEVPEGRR